MAEGPDRSDRWSQDAGEEWVAQQDRYDAMLRPMGLALLAASGLGEGACVLDVGCGCGDTSLEAGHRVGSDGRVVGVDISESMLERARRRAAEAGLAQLEFIRADAQTYRFQEAAFDPIVSRFGVMHFQDPPVAFANLACALRPDGVLAFVCWQEAHRNAWAALPQKIITDHVQIPPGMMEASEGGPFAFADPEMVRGLLQDAGLQGIQIRPLEMSLPVGEDIDDALDFFNATMGRAVLALAGREKADAILADLQRALEPYAGPEGVHLPAAAWLVTARGPS